MTSYATATTAATKQAAQQQQQQQNTSDTTTTTNGPSSPQPLSTSPLNDTLRKCNVVEPLDVTSGGRAMALSDDGGRAASGLHDYDCDSSSLSDGREKADTTPENIKKLCDDFDEATAAMAASATDSASASSSTNDADVIRDEKYKNDLESLSQYHHNYHQHLQHHYGNGNAGPNNNSSSSTTATTPTTATATMMAVGGCEAIASLGLAAAIDESNAKICLGKPLGQLGGDKGCKGNNSNHRHRHNQTNNNNIHHFYHNHNHHNNNNNNRHYHNSNSTINHNDHSHTVTQQHSNAHTETTTTTMPSSSSLSSLAQQQQQHNHYNGTTTANRLTGEIVNNNSNYNNTKISSGSNNNGADDESSSHTTATRTTSASAEASSSPTNSSKQSYAFTIDHFNDKDTDPATTAAKYKNMLERFQNRHRRGASMSKLENSSEQQSDKADAASKMTSSASASVLTLRNGRNGEKPPHMEVENSAAVAKVKLRPRDRSTSRVRDSSKRHSWSPRSSTQDVQHQQQVGDTHTHPHQHPHSLHKPPMSNTTTKKSSATATTTTKGKPPPPPPLQLQLQTQTKGSTTLMANRTQFTPRSTAMQMALQKVDFLCPQPPLADLKHLSMNADEDNVSEAGTYTLDGDNYTEEQKDLMNIDRNARERKLQQQQQQQLMRPKNLKVDVEALVEPPMPSPTTGGPTKIPIRSSNVLEVNYYHDDAADAAPQAPPPSAASAAAAAANLILGNHQSAGAYLEKIKSRVLRNMQKETTCGDMDDDKPIVSSLPSPPLPPSAAGAPQKTPEEDVGCFTSVTTSGILAKQSALDPRPKLTRRCSLSTSQIDSSEYVSNETKLKNAAASGYAAGGFTDHQKAEYRLNVFTNQKASNTGSPHREVGGSGSAKMSDGAVLKTAQTKNDWIQEWARNARARSLATDTPKSAGHNHHAHHHHRSHKHRGGRVDLANSSNDLMTRSYTCSLDTSGGVGGGGSGGCVRQDNDGADSSLTDDSIYNKKCAAAAAAAVASKLNKTLNRLSDNCDYSSDPSLSTSGYAANKQDLIYKPPKSPSKIPSPLHSLGRARSASRTRPSVMQNMMGHDVDIDDDDEDDENSYLHKTAAAINTLQQSLSSRKSSLKSPTHSSAAASPRHQAHTHSATSRLYSPEECSPQHSLDSPTGYHRSPLHHLNRAEPRRSHHHGHHQYAPPMGGSHQLMTSSFNEQQLQLLTSGEYLAKQMRVRKNSFDGKIGAGGLDSPPVRRQPEKYHGADGDSPLRRSSSFSAKIAAANQHHHNHHQRPARPQFQNIYTPPAARYANNTSYSTLTSGPGLSAIGSSSSNAGGTYAIKKSASSNNFRHMYSDYDDNLQYYINDEDDEDCEDCDDLGEECYSSGGEEYGALNESTYYQNETAPELPVAPLSNTRYNKALLMRIERSKQKVAAATSTGADGGKHVRSVSSATSAQSAAAAQARQLAAAAVLAADGGVIACPNTPEMPRRIVRSAPRGGGPSSARQSMPRDTSLNRLATQVPNSLASAKKQLLQTAAAVPTAATAASASASSNKRVQPKYLDISKYKPAQGNNFLRKNDAKSTLKTPAEAMKRSPSSSSMGLSRADPTRTSNRSVRSVASCMTSSATSLGSGRASSAVRRDASVSKQKEVEMAMWKRRSTYDPMKAAAEDRRKKEEAKRMTQYKGDMAMPCESSRSPPGSLHTTTSTGAADQQWSSLGETSTDGGDDEECI